MSDHLKKCPACGGLGYFRCDCWPGDCICGQDEDTCWECDGEGLIDPTYDDDYPDDPEILGPLPPTPRAEPTPEAGRSALRKEERG